MKGHIRIRLTDEQFAKLERLAQQKGCTPEELAVQFIKEYIEEFKKEPNQAKSDTP